MRRNAAPVEPKLTWSRSVPVLVRRSSSCRSERDADDKDAVTDGRSGARVASNPAFDPSVRDWEVLSSSSTDPTTITSVTAVASASNAGPDWDRSGAFGLLRKYSRRRSWTADKVSTNRQVALSETGRLVSA